MLASKMRQMFAQHFEIGAEGVGVLRGYLYRLKSLVGGGCILLLVVCTAVTAETESLELQLTREAWAIDREAFEQQLQAAQNQIRDLSQKLSNQEQTVKSDMAARVDSLDAQLTRVSKERNQVFLENEKLTKDLAKSKEALAAIEALGANRQQESAASQKQAVVIKALSARLEKLVEVSKGRLQEIAALRAENEQLRQEGIALRSALASSEADKEAMMSALKARLESLQARVDRLNQATSRTSAIELAAQPTSMPQQAAQQPKQIQAASQPVAANQAGAPNPSLMVNQTTPPSFVEWMLGKAVEHKVIVLLTLGLMLLLLGAIFVFLKRRSAAQEIPLPEAEELPSPALHAEMMLDPERRMAANDPREILDSAVDSLVLKIRASDMDGDYRLVEPVNNSDHNERTDDIEVFEVVVESEVIIPPVMHDHDEVPLDGDELDAIDGQADDESTDLDAHTSKSTNSQTVADLGEIELTEEAPDQVRDDQSEDIILEVPSDQEITQPEIEPISVFEENLQNQPKDRSSSLFVFIDEAPDEPDSELVAERQAEELTPESIEEASIAEEIEDVPTMAELEESSSPESVETSENISVDEGVSAFITQYRDTEISVVIPKKSGKKKSLLIMDEFPSFGGYSKSRSEQKKPANTESTQIKTDDYESSTHTYGSSSYDEYQLSASEAYLNPKKPVMRMGDAANFGGYGLGNEKKQHKAAQRRTPRRVRGGQRKSGADRVAGFGSNVSPLFDEAKRAEPKRQHELQQAEPSYDPNSLMAHGGVDGDIKSPLVSIPFSLQTKNVYGTKASDGHGAEVFNEMSQPVADQTPDAEFDTFETTFDHTSGFDVLTSDQSTDLDAPEQPPNDPLDDILSGGHLEMPENDLGENVDTQPPLVISDFEPAEADGEPVADHDEHSIDSLLSMAGHDLSVRSNQDSAVAEFHSESVESTLGSWEDTHIETSELSSGQIDGLVDHSMDLATTIGEGGLGLDVTGGASPDSMQSDEFGPALSFGDASAPEETVAQESSPDSMSSIDMPENVVHHPTSPGYSAPEPSEAPSDTQSTDTSSDASDPFEPFIRVLWLIETGETKEARLELEGLLLHHSPDVRRMAYDFKERLEKNEATRA